MDERDATHAPEPEVALEDADNLLEEFSRTRKPELREEIAARYLGFARGLALRYRDRGEAVDDLIQVANLGLLKAIDGFDPEKGPAFEAYATPTILGELRRHFRDHRWALRVPRELKEAIPRIRTAIEDLASKNGEMPTTAEIADHTNLDEEKVDEVLVAAVETRPKSLDAPAGGVDPTAEILLGDQLGSRDGNFDETEYSVMIEERLDRLDDRERETLFLRFAEDLTQAEIAEHLDVSQMQVSRILSGALNRLGTGEFDAIDGGEEE